VSATTFIDTLFVVAMINQRDQHHQRAAELATALQGQRFITTEAILLEIGSALARKYRDQAVKVIETFLSSEDIDVVPLTSQLFRKAFDVYKAHVDKEWSLVDCVSFVAMRQAGIQDAATFDQHFVQAGFRALMRDAA